MHITLFMDLLKFLLLSTAMRTTGLTLLQIEKMKSKHQHIWAMPGRGNSKGKTIA